MIRFAIITACVFVSGSWMAPAVRAESTDRDTLVYYTFDEGEGNVIDHSGHNLNGTLYGASYAAMGEGHALKCSGGKGFAKCASQHALAFGDKDFTIEFLVKLDAFVSGVMMGKKGATPEAAGWHIAYDAAQMKLQFLVSTGQQIAGIDAPLVDLNWHHVMIVREGGRIAIYMDGQVSEGGAATDLPANFDNNNVFLFLGRVPGPPHQ